MGPKKFSCISLCILCFFVILSLLLLSPTVFGRNLSSTPTGSGENSKIGVGPGHSSTAPSAAGQSSPTLQSSSFSYNHSVVSRSTTVCNASGSYSSCFSESSPPTMPSESYCSDYNGCTNGSISPPTMPSETDCSDYNGCTNGSISPPTMPSETDCSDYNGCTNGSIP